MPLWRRERPLHERLAREGGLDFGSERPHDTRPRWGEVGIHGVHRHREWDAVVTVEAPELARSELVFTTLPDGTVVVDAEVEEAALVPLADAVDAVIDAPYRAHAVRREGDVWAVGARRIEVVELDEEIDGDEVELAVQGGDRTLLVDGEPSIGRIRELERLGEERADEYVVQAERLDANLWQVRVAPL